MPDYKFKTCIIDGQEQYDITSAGRQDHLTETRSMRFPGSLLSFIDIEMSEIAPVFSEMSDGLGHLSDKQGPAAIDMVLHSLDTLADRHIYFEIFRQKWTSRIEQSRSAEYLQKCWQRETQHMVVGLARIQRQVKDLFSQVLDIDGEGGPVPEKMISYARMDSSFQFRPQTTH